MKPRYGSPMHTVQTAGGTFNKLLQNMAAKLTPLPRKVKSPDGRKTKSRTLTDTEITEARTLHAFHRWKIREIASRYGVPAKRIEMYLYYRNGCDLPAPTAQLTSEPKRS